MAEVEMDTPPVPRSILVFEDAKLTLEQTAHIREQLRAAIADGDWPQVLCAPGPVYWVPVDDRLSEFARWVVSLRAERRMLDVTMSDIVDAAEKALEGLT